MSHPKISVVIPCYNEEKYLPYCLNSLSKQTFRDFEIIVVNNNCTDKTADIAKSFGANVVREKKQGMIPAREKGFREARAEIIARTDADAIADCNWLKVIYDAFQKYPEVVGVTGPILAPSKKPLDQSIRAYAHIASVILGNLVSSHVYLIGPNMGLRKSVWKKADVHTDERKVHEDIDLSIHLAKFGTIKYLPQMKIVGSLRRVYENPIKGIKLYFGDYGIKYIRTVLAHKKIDITFLDRMKRIKGYRRKEYIALKRLLLGIRMKKIDKLR